MNFSFFRNTSDNHRIIKTFYSRKVFIILFLLISPVVSAQQAIPGLDNVIPPSPTAASLGNFADIPVSFYTGTPDITVPLWQCRGNVINLSISLSYHASGIKVNDIPGWTGTGWALNAGGVITRSTRGLADDLPTGYLSLGRQYLPAVGEDLTPLSTWSPPGQTLSDKYLFLQQVSSNQIDLEPDIFFYNFNGHSGKFMFAPSGEIIIIPAAGLRITYLRDPVTKAIDKWVITDVSGVKYTFGNGAANEVTTPLEANGSPGNAFVSTWYLTDMESPNGEDHFTLTYSDYQNVYRYPVPLKKIGCNEPSREDLFKYTQTRINGKYLNRIFWTRGLIEFDTMNMGGFPGGNITALKWIKIKYPDTGRTFKIFKLDYSFFQATGCGTEQDYLPPCRRLRLDKITEYAGDFSQHKPPWQFFYDEQPMPPRGSFSQDYWGYYNGKPNDHMIPSLRVFNYPDRSAMPPKFNGNGRTNFERLVQRNLNIENLEYYAWDIPGADRTPDSLCMQAGILKKIIYPAGGSTHLEYEPHTFGYFSHHGTPEELVVTAHNPEAKDVISSFHLDFDQFVYVIPLFFNFHKHGKGGLRDLFSLEVNIPTGIPIDNGNPSPGCLIRIYPEDTPDTANSYFELSWADATDSTGGFEAEYRVWLKKGNYKLLAHAPETGDSVVTRLTFDTTSSADKVYPVYGNSYQQQNIQAGMVYFLDDSSYFEAKRFTLTGEDDPLVSLHCFFRSKIHPNRISAATLEYPVTTIRLIKIPGGEKVYESTYYDGYGDSLQWDDQAGEWYLSADDKLLLEPGVYELAFIPRIHTEYGMGQLSYRKAVASHNSIMAGGVRIKKIIETSHGNDTIGIREFRYEMEPGKTSHSSGILINFPCYDEVLLPLYYYPKNDPRLHYWCLPVSIFSTGKTVLGSTSGSHLGYARISVSEPGNGRTDYEYTSPFEVADITSERFPFVPAISVDWQRGLLKRKTVYTEDGRIRQTETTTYHLPGNGIDSLWFYRIPAVKVAAKIPGQVYSNIWDTYYTQTGWSFPVKKVSTYYGLGESQPLVTEEHYGYSVKNLLVNETEKTNSDGTKLKTRILYSADMLTGNAATDTMHSRHMNDVVIKTETYRDSVRIDATENYYGLFNNNRLAMKDSVRILAGDSFRTQVVFDRYDSKGHILQIHRPGGPFQSFHWNRYGMPVAKVENSKYQDNISGYSETSHITKYTFDVLAGMTSVTDPNGRKTTYSHDRLGRLQTIRDPDNRILRQAEYHYQEYEGDTTRKYFNPEDYSWSLPPVRILTTDTPLVRTCSALLTVEGGVLGSGATWHWYSGGCGVNPSGTGSSVTVSPQQTTTLFVRAESRVNITRCAEISVSVTEPEFHPETDTILIPSEGTSAHPLLFLPGYSGCDPWTASVDQTWITLSGENSDNISITAGANNTGMQRACILTISAVSSELQVPVIQNPVPVLSVSVSWTPAFIRPGDAVTLTASVEGGTAPYDYVWDMKTDGEITWTLIGKHFSQNLSSDEVTVTAGNVSFYVRCRVTSGSRTAEVSVRLNVAV